jgi:hypothetical protein
LARSKPAHFLSESVHPNHLARLITLSLWGMLLAAFPARVGSEVDAVSINPRQRTSTTRRLDMGLPNRDEIEGKFDQAKGKTKETVGRVKQLKMSETL